jgi:hypothetical protein
VSLSTVAMGVGRQACQHIRNNSVSSRDAGIEQDENHWQCDKASGIDSTAAEPVGG